MSSVSKFQEDWAAKPGIVFVGGKWYKFLIARSFVMNFTKDGDGYEGLCEHCNEPIVAVTRSEMIELCADLQADMPFVHSYCVVGLLADLGAVEIKPPSTNRGVTSSEVGEE